MDSIITAAARALAAGDPLGALKRVALRDDPPALALRGIAIAQLGDLVRAKALLRSAARAFGAHEAVARARCVVAEAEIALAARDRETIVPTTAVLEWAGEGWVRGTIPSIASGADRSFVKVSSAPIDLLGRSGLTARSSWPRAILK